jgi:hypothetical protein
MAAIPAAPDCRIVAFAHATTSSRELIVTGASILGII